ncbi:MAG: hypothetical protein WD906_05465 [Anaerolineales bacterium]
MESIVIFAVLGLLLAVSLGGMPDSRDHVPSQEEILASYSMTWGGKDDYEAQVALATELRAALKEYQAARSSGRDPGSIEESRSWADRLVA